MPKQAAQSSVSSKLISDGWQDFKHGVYIKQKPFAITLVAFSEDKSGKVRGFVLKRKLGD